MPTTTIIDATFSVAAIQARTDTLGDPTADDQNAEEARLWANLMTPGIFEADDFQVLPGVGMSIDVGSGNAKSDLAAVQGSVAGQGLYLVRDDDGLTNIAVPASDLSNPRVDEIYLVVADNLYDLGGFSLPRYGYRTGDAAASPLAPGPDSGWTAYYLLATIDVSTALGNITSGEITDERTVTSLVIGDFLTVGDAAAEYLTILDAATTYLPLAGNAVSADQWATARQIALTGDATGSVMMDGSANVAIATTVLAAATAAQADKWTNQRSITLTGDVTGSVFFDGSGNFVLPAVVANDSHSHGTQYLPLNSNAVTASRWLTARTITLTGDVSGAVSIRGDANVSMTTAVGNDSHTHSTQYVLKTGGEFTGEVTFRRGGASNTRSWKFKDTTTGAYYREVGSAGFGFTIGGGAGADYVATTSGFSSLLGSKDLGSASFPWDNVIYTGDLIDLSDPRMKKNMRPLDTLLPEGVSALDVVREVPAIAYDWKAKAPSKGFQTRQQGGFNSLLLREVTGGLGTAQAHDPASDPDAPYSDLDDDLIYTVPGEQLALVWEALRELALEVYGSAS